MTTGVCAITMGVPLPSSPERKVLAVSASASTGWSVAAIVCASLSVAAVTSTWMITEPAAEKVTTTCEGATPRREEKTSLSCSSSAVP